MHLYVYIAVTVHFGLPLPGTSAFPRARSTSGPPKPERRGIQQNVVIAYSEISWSVRAGAPLYRCVCTHGLRSRFRALFDVVVKGAALVGSSNTQKSINQSINQSSKTRNSPVTFFTTISTAGVTRACVLGIRFFFPG